MYSQALISKIRDCVEQHQFIAVITVFKRLGLRLDYDNNYFIRLTAIEGFTSAVYLLLNETTINPMVDENKPLINAIEYNYYDVACLLIKDKRVDPSYMKNAALWITFELGDRRMAKLLLKDKRVKKTSKNHDARAARFYYSK